MALLSVICYQYNLVYQFRLLFIYTYIFWTKKKTKNKSFKIINRLAHSMNFIRNSQAVALVVSHYHYSSVVFKDFLFEMCVFFCFMLHQRGNVLHIWLWLFCLLVRNKFVICDLLHVLSVYRRMLHRAVICVWWQAIEKGFGFRWGL